MFSPRRSTGFVLVTVTALAALLLLLGSSLLLSTGAMRRDGIALRSSTDTFYAAEAGINSILARLTEQNYGTASGAIALSTLQLNGTAAIVTGTGNNRTPVQVSADVASGSLALGSNYYGATPQSLGTGLGFVVFCLNARTTTGPWICNGGSTPPTSIANNVQQIDIAVIGFKGRSAATALSVSILPGTAGGTQNFFRSYPYAAIARNNLAMNNGDTSSARPFVCTATGCTVGTITYFQSICQSGVTYTPRTGACQTGETLVNSVVPAVLNALNLSGYTPYIPTGAPSSYNWVPRGNIGNIASNGESGGSITVQSQGVVNGIATHFNCSSGCINGNGRVNFGATIYGCTTSCVASGTTVNGGITSSASAQPLNLPAAPTPPTTTETITINGTGTYGTVNGTCPTTPRNILIQSFNINGQQAVTLCSGNYVLAQNANLNISGGQRLNLQLNANGDPIRIYMSPNTSVDLSGNSGVNGGGRAAWLQIYGAASNPGSISLGNNQNSPGFSGLVYAPNSVININGAGHTRGAFVGLHVNYGGNQSRLIYDESLGDENLPITVSAGAASSPRLANWRRF
jgi:hypothetical protein